MKKYIFAYQKIEIEGQWGQAIAKNIALHSCSSFFVSRLRKGVNQHEENGC